MNAEMKISSIIYGIYIANSRYIRNVCDQIDWGEGYYRLILDHLSVGVLNFSGVVGITNIFSKLSQIHGSSVGAW